MDSIQRYHAKFYNANAGPWALAHTDSFWHEAPFRKFIRYFKAGDAILDIGCGDGWISIRAAGEGHRAWDIDTSPTAIAEAKAAARKTGVGEWAIFQVGEALALPYGDHAFDAVVDRGLFHHILPENRPSYFKNILRVLKPRGLLYLSVFTMQNPAGIGQRFSRTLLDRLFGPHFVALAADLDPWPTAAPAHLIHLILERRPK